MSFSDLYIAQMKATRDAFDRETTFTTGPAVPVTPVSVAVQIWQEWVDKAERVAAAGIAPTAEGLLFDDDAFGPSDTVFGKLYPAVDKARKLAAARLALEKVRSGESARVAAGMRELAPFQVGHSRPIDAFIATGTSLAAGLSAWFFDQRWVGSTRVSVLHPTDAQDFWNRLRKLAISADSAAKKTIKFETRVTVFVSTAKQQGRVVAETLGDVAADVADYGAELAGRAVASFATASGIVAVLVIGGGIWFLSTKAGAGAAAAVIP